MSLKLTSWAWELSLPLSQKMTLMALCDHANDEGMCFPSLSRLAARCSLARSSLIEAINALERAGYVSREKDAGKSTQYWINQSVKRTSPDNGLVRLPDLTSPSAGPDPSAKRTLIVNNHKEPPTMSESDFDVFWKSYPKKTAKERAKKVWKKLKGVSLTEVLNGVERYKQTGEVRRGYIKHPATWLNDGAWTDENIEETYDELEGAF